MERWKLKIICLKCQTKPGSKALLGVDKRIKPCVTLADKAAFYSKHLALQSYLDTFDSSSAVVFLDVHVNLCIADKAERRNKENVTTGVTFISFSFHNV